MNGVLITEGQFPKVSRLNVRLYWLAKMLNAGGNNVTFLSPSDSIFYPKSGTFEGIAFFQFPGFAKLLHGKTRLFVRLLHLASSIASVFLILCKKKISFLHAWNPVAGFSAAISSKVIGKPFFLDFTDFYSDIARQEAPMLARIFEWMESFVSENARAVFVVSDVMKRRLVAKGIPAEKIFIVADGTDTKTFKPIANVRKITEKLGLPKNKTVVFHGGDIKHADGADLLLEAFALVLKEVPDARLLIVGGKQEEIDLLKNLSERLSVSKSVVFTGLVPMAEVPWYLNAASIGAMPLRRTLNHECYLSFKIFEYWACGKPVVVSRLKAISEIAKQDKNAVLCAPEDIWCFAKSLVFLLKHPNVAKRFGENGRKMVVGQFDWRRLMGKEAKIVLSRLAHN